MVEMGFDNLAVEWSIWNLGLRVRIGGSELFWVEGEGKVGVVERWEGEGYVELWREKNWGSYVWGRKIILVEFQSWDLWMIFKL